MLVLSVYDAKAEAYLQPFYMKTKGEAIRAFMSVVNDGQSSFSKYPEDYTLFILGEWDEDKGVISQKNVKEPLGTALEFKKELK